MLSEFDDILTVQDTATILMVGKNTVYSLLETNTLKGFRIGRTWKVPKDAFNRECNTKCVNFFILLF